MNKKKMFELVNQISDRSGGVPVVLLIGDGSPHGLYRFTNVASEYAEQMMHIALSGKTDFFEADSLTQTDAETLKMSDEIASKFGPKISTRIANYMAESGHECDTRGQTAIVSAFLHMAILAAAIFIPEESLENTIQGLLRVLMAHTVSDREEIRKCVAEDLDEEQVPDNRTVH